MKPFTRTADLPAEATSLRQALFLATSSGLVIGGSWLMVDSLRADGISWLDGVLLVLFVILFTQLCFGFSIAFWGFLISAFGGDRWQIMRTLEGGGDAVDPPGAPGSTAVVMPIFNEDTSRIFRGLENMVRSLEATGQAASFDFFILSDSNDPDRWISEEAAWLDLSTRMKAFGRIFYRKRRVSLHGKSGNIADFCRRWGTRYRYLIILDADSLMAGSTLVRLARVMDANPQVGIVQTGPQIIRGESLLQRLLQFATRSVGPIFAAGANFWHLGGGNYWGHNAIIRLQPFMEHCVLPELPGRNEKERHILSHDTVEASLMKQAGYQVWFAYLEPGSYEEGPPNLSESLKRDRRWCQGNLQHYWFLFAPHTRFENRLHIFFGLMAYLSAPLLVVFIFVSAVYFYLQNMPQFFTDPAMHLSGSDQRSAVWLLVLTLGLLFLPKILGTLLVLPRAKSFGGIAAVLVSSLLEVLFSVLLAPIMLFFYTKFVLLTWLGLRIDWKTQNRDQAGIPLGEAVRDYFWPTVAGIAAAATAWVWTPALLPWLSPILFGLVFAVPLVILTSSEAVGGWMRRRGLLLIPEEIDPPELFQGLDDCVDHLEEGARAEYQGLVQLALSPRVNSAHLALLRRSKARPRQVSSFEEFRSQLLKSGPDALGQRELRALLWDAQAVARLHEEIWKMPESELHPWWQHAMRHFNETATTMARASSGDVGRGD